MFKGENSDQSILATLTKGRALVRVFKLALRLAEEIDDALVDAELLGDLARVLLCCDGLADCFSLWRPWQGADTWIFPAKNLIERVLLFQRAVVDVSSDDYRRRWY